MLGNFWRSSYTAPPEATNSSAPYLPYCCAGGQQKYESDIWGTRTQAYVLTLVEHERKLVF